MSIQIWGNFKHFGKDQYWHSIFGFVMSETDRPFGSEFSTHQNVFTLFKLNFFIFYQQWMEQTYFIVYTTYQVHTKGEKLKKTWILETYDSKYFIGTYFPSTELTCALIINIFIFSFCQLTAKRSGTAFDRCCKNAVNLRSYLDIVIWIALSDLRKISYEHNSLSKEGWFF